MLRLAVIAAVACVAVAAPDPCLDVLYADKHYGDCCGSGNYKQPGHQPVCHELQKERREEGDAKNIDYHKEPPESKVSMPRLPQHTELCADTVVGVVSVPSPHSSSLHFFCVPAAVPATNR